MELNKVTMLTKNQAKAYAVIALDALSYSQNDLDVKQLWDEIETIMKLYTPKQATRKADDIFSKGEFRLWKKK